MRLAARSEPGPAAGICGLAMLLCLTTSAQESIRMSMAGASAAAARRAAAESIGYYNVKLGPTGWRFGAGLGAEYTDNVQLSEAGGADVAFSPQLTTQMLWPVTEQNALNLSVGAGYQAYLQHSQFDRFFVTPGSELSFDLYAGDFWFNFHDRFSISENSAQDPTVAGVADYSQLQNAAGLSTLWDLNKLLLKAGYDHVNYQALSGTAGAQDGVSEVFSASAGYLLHPDMQLGVEAGGSLLSYSSAGTNGTPANAVQWNSGLFFQGQVSEYISLGAHLGYTQYLPDAAAGPLQSTRLNAVYGEVDITHRLNEYINYTLSGGRSVSAGFYGGSVDLYFVSWQANWKLIRQVDLGTSFLFQHGTQFSFGHETFDWYGPGLSLGRTLTRKLTGTLAYQYYWRGSNLPGRDYTMNTVTLTLAYQF